MEPAVDHELCKPEPILASLKADAQTRVWLVPVRSSCGDPPKTNQKPIGAAADDRRQLVTLLTNYRYDARQKIKTWRREYNGARPHGIISDRPPIVVQSSFGLLP